MICLRGALRSLFQTSLALFSRFALGLQEEHLLSATVERASDHPAADKEILRLPSHILQRALHSARKIFGSFSLFRPRAFLRLISGVFPRLRVFSRPFRHRGCMGQNYACFGVIFSGLYNKVVKPSLLTVDLSFNFGVDLCLILRG